MSYSKLFNRNSNSTICSDTISRAFEKDGVPLQQSWRFEATPNKKGQYDIVENIEKHDGTMEQKIISSGVISLEEARQLVERHYNFRVMTVGQASGL